MMLRGGIGNFQIETGRWKGIYISRRERVTGMRKWKIAVIGCCNVLYRWESERQNRLTRVEGRLPDCIPD